jgi:hypothetical protein
MNVYEISPADYCRAVLKVKHCEQLFVGVLSPSTSTDFFVALLSITGEEWGGYTGFARIHKKSISGAATSEKVENACFQAAKYYGLEVEKIS